MIIKFFSIIILALLVGCGGGSSAPESNDNGGGGGGNSNVPDICDSDADTYFVQNVFPILQNRCMTCHVAGGQAGNTRWQVQSVAADTQSQIDALIEQAGFQFVLDKPSGAISHGGGTRLTSGSTDFEIFAQYVQFIGVDDFCD